MLDTFRPDLVLYDAGVDPHREDELGRLRLTDEGETIIEANRHSSTCLNFEISRAPQGCIREICT